MFLGELRKPVAQLSGIGPKIAASLARLGIGNVSELLYHFPRAYEDRRREQSIATAGESPVNTIVEVTGHVLLGRGPKKTLKVNIADSSARASLLCFGRAFLAEQLKIGQKYYLWGHFQSKYGEQQSSAFEFSPYLENEPRPELFSAILPVYALTSGLRQSFFRKIIPGLLAGYAKNLDNEIPAETQQQRRLLSSAAALKAIHQPADQKELDAACRTIKFQELFYLQLTVSRRAHSRKARVKRERRIPGALAETLIRRLPFDLTGGQKKVLDQIKADMQHSRMMARLVQGDVGSGKTLVALLSALYCIEAGRQVAFMAPTELLAQQHAENSRKWLSPLGVKLAYLTGNLKDKNRRPLVQALAGHEIDLIIGTHALFSKDVVYSDLGLIVIDEQHRFGVAQRRALSEKGDCPDLLLMTATPIPRTLALTAYGDLDLSVITEMPKGRAPVITHLSRSANAAKVYQRVRQELEQGRQAYFVYPLIEASGKIRLSDAQNSYDRLKNKVYPDFRLGLLHSGIEEAEKKKTMRAFVEGRLDVLVATSVVEVGVDVANANCMVIEHAERFGLSALHQLRGRVGRGGHQSYAFLIYEDKLSPEGKERLLVIKKHNSGFVIAEEDLRLRGPGELTGRRQSGFAGLRLASLIWDKKLLELARRDARQIIDKDPSLQSKANQCLKACLGSKDLIQDQGTKNS